VKRLQTIFAGLAETVAGLMMAAIFVTFLIQIAVRYVVGSSWFTLFDSSMFGWTLETIMVLWLWTIFWGNAFVVRERDHVTFDIVYLWVRPAVRRWLAIIGAVAIVIGLWASIGPTYDKMKILRIKSSATLPVKMLPIYSIFFVFLAVVGLRYAWRAYEVFRHGLPEHDHEISEIVDQ
jgi:C4-dicarboxylate transporter DctQ subunit